MSLLESVADAAERVRVTQLELAGQREFLRMAIRAARDEGIPFTRIAKAAGLSHERVRQLYAGR